MATRSSRVPFRPRRDRSARPFRSTFPPRDRSETDGRVSRYGSGRGRERRQGRETGAEGVETGRNEVCPVGQEGTGRVGSSRSVHRGASTVKAVFDLRSAGLTESACSVGKSIRVRRRAGLRGHHHLPVPVPPLDMLRDVVRRPGETTPTATTGIAIGTGVTATATATRTADAATNVSATTTLTVGVVVATKKMARRHRRRTTARRRGRTTCRGRTGVAGTTAVSETLLATPDLRHRRRDGMTGDEKAETGTTGIVRNAGSQDSGGVDLKIVAQHALDCHSAALPFDSRAICACVASAPSITTVE